MDGLPWMEPDAFEVWRADCIKEFMLRSLHRAERDALLCLSKMVAAGDPSPTDSAVAKAARCCRRTVIRARQVAKRLGILLWEKTWRLVGNKMHQGPNRYQLKPLMGDSRSPQSGAPHLMEESKSGSSLLYGAVETVNHGDISEVEQKKLLRGGELDGLAELISRVEAGWINQ